MKPSSALITLHEAGLVLAPNPTGGLAVSPASRITPELRIVIKTNRDDLLAQLRQEASNDPSLHLHSPDRYCWPHSMAMNGQEIDTFTARLAQFTDNGLSPEAAEKLADELVFRDREDDDRQLCVECPHLQGQGRWRCGKWEAAEMAREGLAPDLVQTLQRCGGYPNATNNGA